VIEFKDEDFAKMQAVQRDLTTVLLRANADRVEAAVAVFALVRCARPLLDRYNDSTRLALLEVIEAFLHHEPAEPSHLLVM
jgi:hypothetical protein